MELIGKMIDHFWNMVFDLIIEEKEYEKEIFDEIEDVELSAESFYIYTEFAEIETPLLLQQEEWDSF